MKKPRFVPNPLIPLNILNFLNRVENTNHVFVNLIKTTYKTKQIGFWMNFFWPADDNWKFFFYFFIAIILKLKQNKNLATIKELHRFISSDVAILIFNTFLNHSQFHLKYFHCLLLSYSKTFVISSRDYWNPTPLKYLGTLTPNEKCLL